MKILLTNLLLFIALTLTAQLDPVKWSYDTKKISNTEYDLIFTANIQDGWTIYSQYLESDDGPVRTSFDFFKNPDYQLVGKASEGGGKKTMYDNVFGMELIKFYHNAIFTQRIKVTPGKALKIKGYHTSMACDASKCLPPKEVDFEFNILPSGNTETPPPPVPANKPTNNKPQTALKNNTTNKATSVGEKKNDNIIVAPVTETGIPATDTSANQTNAAQTDIAAPQDENFKGFFDAKREIDASKWQQECGNEIEEVTNSTSNWWTFVLGFFGGLLALLTPCVFPMIPLTVSYFTKSSKDRASGIRNALIYGSSIILIYCIIGIVLTSIFGPTVLNEMSTDMYFNLIFFIVFVIFAISFFGYFEITLPSSWANSTDRAADQGGLIGIFFMAFTLALVSFSCTGPIIGTLLVQTVSGENDMLFGLAPVKPLMGMLGFSSALALPFGLFAAFPSWLNSLPKSGSWMTNVKVTLGFLELALALKFLSTADMVRHWNFLKFELFLGLWIIIFLCLALYQFGFIRFPHDAPLKRITLPRWIIGLSSLLFVGYIANGLINYKPLSLLSGLAPPVHYNFFRPMTCPHGLDCYHDIDEALAVAQKDNKPLFVDFTGYGCVNCRKMEENVWVKPEINTYLKDKYVLVSLYVDDQKRLFPDSKQMYLLDKVTNQKLRTEGSKWAAYQISNFGKNSQPYYVLMHNDGKTLLNKPRDYTPNVKVYENFLACGLDAFNKLSASK
ncbi:MAG: thioredoxin family protein [Saprospiraceae bacterium]|nr:thioredoxin family protein [Saprospiraceae bacterium]MBP7699227.1 thioredoxin family protein [Saprospiraceae bacterium]